MANEEKHSEAWWTGYLSQALKDALRDLDYNNPEHAKTTIQRTLRNWEEHANGK